jgi:hypothetical protein
LKSKLLSPLKKTDSKKAKELDKKWPEIAKCIREFYYDKRQLVAFFAPKHLLGRGVFEPHETCLRPDGEYAINGDFFKAYRRGKMLALAGLKDGHIDPEENGGGRCLVHFRGGHRIVLTNFYYRGMPNNKQLFIDAIVKMFKMPKNSVKTSPADSICSEELPIYLNGGAIQLDFGVRPPWTRPRMMPCPHCGREVKHTRFIFNNGDYNLGCEDCYEDNNRTCYECGGHINDDNACYSEITEQEYCEDCYDDNFVTCYSCSEVLRQDSAVVSSLNNSPYCENCYDRLFVRCADCNLEMSRVDAFYYNFDAYCEDHQPIEEEEDEIIDATADLAGANI